VRVGKVPALQENLAARAASGATPAKDGNLDDAIAIVQNAASQMRVSLTELTLVMVAVRADCYDWSASHPADATPVGLAARP
jgi:hypothetical protein